MAVLAGHKLNTLDFLPTVEDTQVGSFSFDATTFGVDADSGTYVDCGVAFTGPNSGAVKIDYSADLDNSLSTASTNLAPVVRTGSTVGSGSTVLAASLDICIRNVGTDDRRYGASLLLEGLTPGSAYNVRLEHRVSGNTGTIQQRNVVVTPVN
jgi:hypothetical protein